MDNREKVIPKVVKIGNHEYVVSQEYDGYMMGGGLWGEVFYADLQIRLRSSLAPGRKEEVLCHEIIHALFQEAGLAADMVQNENIVKPVGVAFYRLLQDNDFSFMYQGVRNKATTEAPLRIEVMEALRHLELGSCVTALALLRRLAEGGKGIGQPSDTTVKGIAI